jgi:hypothetical protein
MIFSPSHPLTEQWHCEKIPRITVAGPRRICTGFPFNLAAKQGTCRTYSIVQACSHEHYRRPIGEMEACFCKQPGSPFDHVGTPANMHVVRIPNSTLLFMSFR